MSLALNKMKFVWAFSVIFAVITFSWTYFIVQKDSTFQTSQNRTSPIRQSFKNLVGYVISLGYARANQQQGRCAVGIVAMQCWLKSFDLPMHIVEPLVSSSKFLGLPNSNSQWVKFGDIYDIDQFNKLTGVDKGFAQLIRWDDFLQVAPRNIIFVRIGLGRRHQIAVEWEMQLQHKDTNNSFKPLPYLQDRGFSIVKVVNTVIGADNHPFTAEDMNNVIFTNWRPEEITLVFSVWRPPYVVPNPKLKNPLVCQNFYAKGHQFFPPSKQLLQVVQKYINLFLKPSISIAVMIRSEHIMFSLGYLKQNETLVYQTITTVFNNLIATVRKLQASIGHRNILIVTADIGKYRSNTWHDTVKGWDKNLTSGVLEIIKRTVTTLYSNSWTFEEWEQSFGTASGGIEDQSYVAALQKAIAGRAQCLLLFGGGGFQLVALYEYLRNHPTPSKECWKFLYTRKNFKGQYLQLVAKYSGIKIDDVGVSAYLQHLLHE